MPKGTPEVLAVIPARYGSERFPAKPLALIDGVPMVVRVLRNVAQAATVDRVVVATDDDRIADAVREAGGEAVITASELPSGSDRVWAVAEPSSAAIVVNVQGDEPLLPATIVDALVRRLLDADDCDIATPVVRGARITASSPDVVTVACSEAGIAHYFSRSTIPYGAEEVLRHVGVYAYRRDALERFVRAPVGALEAVEKLEQLRALSLGLRIAAVDVDVVLHAVDRPEDVAAVERLLAAPEATAPVARARLVVLDVDGVLTDGRIAYLGDAQLVSFDVKDGYGIVALRHAGIEVAALTARDSPALRHRAAELGIVHLRTNVVDKVAELAALAREVGVTLAETCYVGDDVPDVAVMATAGLSAAPADAAPEARAAATVVLAAAGGRGAVRELARLLLDG
jgi:3-deoxy-D-manno-octulosonate 8-phosphate phosphatase (KDO 8-P phosphatase)